MRSALPLVALAGTLAGAAAWYFTARPAETRDSDLTDDRGGHRSTAGSSEPTDAIAHRRSTPRKDDPRGSPVRRRVVSEDIASSRKVDWEESRDPGWAAPMERALGSLAEERLARLLPEGMFRDVTCRRTSCSFEIACRVDEIDMCQQMASVLVLVDGMTLRMRQQGADLEGWVPLLVDVALPPGDADQMRAAIAAELAAHPEVTERLANYLGILRRERAEGPP